MKRNKVIHISKKCINLNPAYIGLIHVIVQPEEFWKLYKLTNYKRQEFREILGFIVCYPCSIRNRD